MDEYLQYIQQILDDAKSTLNSLDKDWMNHIKGEKTDRWWEKIHEVKMYWR